MSLTTADREYLLQGSAGYVLLQDLKWQEQLRISRPLALPFAMHSGGRPGGWTEKLDPWITAAFQSGITRFSRYQLRLRTAARCSTEHTFNCPQTAIMRQGAQYVFSRSNQFDVDSKLITGVNHGGALNPYIR